MLGRPQGPEEGAYPLQGISPEGVLGALRVRPMATGDHLSTFPGEDFWGLRGQKQSLSSEPVSVGPKPEQGSPDQ